MRTHFRHAFGLALALGLAALLSGCYRSAGGSLEPTPVTLDGAQVAMQNTPLPAPSQTPTEAGVLTEEPAPAITDGESAAGEATEEALDVPTPEIATEPPSPIPPSETPTEAADVAALPDGQGGLDAEAGLTPTESAAVAILPTNTPAPSLTPTPLPSATPTFGPTATFTTMPFNPLPPTPTYTQFSPPAQAAAAGEAVPLAERPVETLPPAGAVVGGEVTPTAAAIAQQATLSIPQMTSTALLESYYMTQAALQGTIFPTPTVGLGAEVAPADGQGGLEIQIATSTPTAAPAAAAGICSEHLVSPGENLFRLSLTYGVTVDAIAQANNITNPNLILAGDTLQIPCQVAATTAPDGQGGLDVSAQAAASPGTYIVEPGDNLYRISIRFGVTMTALMNANGMTPATINQLYAGQQLVIP